jgi:hypothetical protein
MIRRRLARKIPSLFLSLSMMGCVLPQMYGDRTEQGGNTSEYTSGAFGSNTTSAGNTRTTNTQGGSASTLPPIANGGTALETRSSVTSGGTGGVGTTLGGASNGATTITSGGFSTTGGQTTSGVGCTRALETYDALARLCVTKTKTLPASTSVPSYGIDTTEVTRDQYAAWLATNPPLPSASDSECGYKANGSHIPESQCMTAESVCKIDCAAHPVVCIDWCSARAYCRAANKRLCGDLRGGPLSNSNVNGLDSDEWYRACRSAGNNTYPYGSDFSPNACNGQAYWGVSSSAHFSLPVAKLRSCQSDTSDYSGVFDMSGNVWEWSDSCTGTGADGKCQLRGGSFSNESDNLACNSLSLTPRSTLEANVGFRCCSE